MANRVVVLLSDEEFEDVKGRAGLVPLSAWFRSLIPVPEDSLGGKLSAEEFEAVKPVLLTESSMEISRQQAVRALGRGIRLKGDKTR